ncbi:hypothetical protein VNO77_41993 [Canavalia gladiata]|uniref:Uncharacterized protein n=1 Tax=Canavalia gladiata TaxID=3824 RepID=A0AAN9PSB5_CANGL
MQHGSLSQRQLRIIFTLETLIHAVSYPERTKTRDKRRAADSPKSLCVVSYSTPLPGIPASVIGMACVLVLSVAPPRGPLGCLILSQMFPLETYFAGQSVTICVILFGPSLCITGEAEEGDVHMNHLLLLKRKGKKGTLSKACPPCILALNMGKAMILKPD